MISGIKRLLALPWWRPDALWWPMAAGLLYVLLSSLGSYAACAAQRWQARQTSPGLIRLGRWGGWVLVEQAVSLCVGLGWTFVLLVGGVYAPDDVGVSPVAWEQALPWAGAITVGATAWIGLLWTIYRQRSRPDTDVRASATSVIDFLLDSGYQETQSAILRASLIPGLGTYWGIWGAVIAKSLAARLNPRLRARLRVAGQRELVYLDWALDWVGAALFLFGRSVWIALAGRTLCRLLILGILGRTRPLQRCQRMPGSGQDHCQPDQRAEHGGSEDPDALQVA